MMAEIEWSLVFGLGVTGIPMALLSSLVGMRPRVEIPLWWGLYAVWVAVVVLGGGATPFRTILLASILAGLLHATTQSALLDAYLRNNPWHAERMDKPRGQLRAQFLISGLVIGAGFGALVAAIAWGLHRL